MADDKVKRFRVHVIKEICNTEKDYLQKLQFVVKEILERSRLKEKHELEKSFTEEIIQTLFCNIEEIVELHTQLCADLEPLPHSYDAKIASCFVKHGEQFQVYKKYGENNEHAQKLLRDLEQQPFFKAFFVGVMLLGGKGDESVATYLFKPIQRVCKYPLLFRELAKYTPKSHPDYRSTQEALTVMRDACSVINEAKRRVEKLEAIEDWQGGVEGWEGSKVVDTCNELVKEGPLIKISAGNSQERMFFLFDNLLVYCKKSLLSRNKPLLFRGRIAVENLDIENIEDGTADYHTNGITVRNSWKVHNIAKNKWFVLIAKNPEEKQQWVEAIRKEKDRRKRLAAGIAQDKRNLVIAKGEKIHGQLRSSKEVIRDHKVRFKTYSNSFSGEELVRWLLEHKEVTNEGQAVILCQALLENGVIHHVQDKHQFKQSDLLYRFRYDDGTFRAKYESHELVARGVRLYCQLHSLFDPIIRDLKQAIGKPLKNVVCAQKLVDWLVVEHQHDVGSREKAVQLCQEFFATGILRHVTDAHGFRDGMFYYRFTADDAIEVPASSTEQRRQSMFQRTEFTCVDVSSVHTVSLPYSEEEGGYGLQLSSEKPLVILSATQSVQDKGLCAGQVVVSLCGEFLSSCEAPPEEAQELVLTATKSHAPLVVGVKRAGGEVCSLYPPFTGGLGFQIKGSSPVVIHAVEQGSSAARAGILPGCCILRVGDKEMVRATHDAVVSAIKHQLAASRGNKEGPGVVLKLGYGRLDHLACFHYETSQECPVRVYERTLESPYTFQLPHKLMEVYCSELESLSDDLVSSGLKDTRVTGYIQKLQAQVAESKRTIAALSGPRWPSYKPHGTATSSTLEACPTNLHTIAMEVVSQSSSHVPSYSDNEVELSPPPIPTERTSYFTSTMAVPSVKGKTFSKEDIEKLEAAEIRRDLLNQLLTQLSELKKDRETGERIVSEVKQNETASPDPFSLSVSLASYEELTPLHTPSSSPLPLRRQRLLSVATTQPVLKLVAEGFLQKLTKLSNLLHDKLMLSVLREADVLIPSRKAEELLEKFQEDLDNFEAEFSAISRRPSVVIAEVMTSLIEVVERRMKDLRLRLDISLAMCDDLELLSVRDKVFSQCLAAVVSQFAHHLIAALSGTLNPEAEFTSNAEASQRWLQLVAKRGLLVYLETSMLVQVSSEEAMLKALVATSRHLENVVFHISEASEDQSLSSKSELPDISLLGNRSELHVTLSLHPSHYQQLPEAMLSPGGISLHPVIFNKGLTEEDAPKALKWEKELNNQSLVSLRTYYRSLRAFRLDKASLPEENDARLIAISQINQPLNSMDHVMRELEVAVREPAQPSVEMLVLAAELATRMGALKIVACNSGVFRSQLSSSLEHVMVLCRCHSLPFRGLRTALNLMRGEGALSLLLKKNDADIGTAFPKQPPRLYQVPNSLTVDNSYVMVSMSN